MSMSRFVGVKDDGVWAFDVRRWFRLRKRSLGERENEFAFCVGRGWFGFHWCDFLIWDSADMDVFRASSVVQLVPVDDQQVLRPDASLFQRISDKDAVESFGSKLVNACLVRVILGQVGNVGTERVDWSSKWNVKSALVRC